MTEERSCADARELASARFLRTTVIVFCAGQMALGWAVPLVWGSVSNALVRIGFATGSSSLAMWTGLLAVGHLVSLRYAGIQRPTGFLHSATCLYIGLRLFTLDYLWQAAVYAFVYSIPGLAILITARPGRGGR